jgi:hypothetical protein
MVTQNAAMQQEKLEILGLAEKPQPPRELTDYCRVGSPISGDIQQP